MDFRSYIVALRRFWWIAALTTALGLAGAAVAYGLTPSVYASEVTFYVSTPVQNGVSPQSSNEFAESRVNSYVILASSERVADAIVDRTGVDLTAAQVMSKITAEAELNTVVVRATVRDSSQARAQTLAQGLADTLGGTVSLLDNAGGTGKPTVVINVVSGPAALGPVEPRLKVFAGLGIAAGLVVGAVLIVVRELLDNTVRGPESAAAAVGAPVLGNIGFDPEFRRSPLMVGSRAASLGAEAFRQLRTNLTFVNATQTRQVLVVTSSVPSEGKTSVCVNLALMLAEAGRRVLLVESDLRRPSLAITLGLESEAGLTNVLINQLALDNALQEWTPKITVLTSGSLPPNPSELLESHQAAELIEQLRPRFDHIIIDTTPLLPVTDAAVASALGDGVLMVVRHGRTTRDQAADAVKSLHAVNAEVIGTVLTMRRRQRKERQVYRYRNREYPSAKDWDVADSDSSQVPRDRQSQITA